MEYGFHGFQTIETQIKSLSLNVARFWIVDHVLVMEIAGELPCGEIVIAI